MMFEGLNLEASAEMLLHVLAGISVEWIDKGFAVVISSVGYADAFCYSVQHILHQSFLLACKGHVLQRILRICQFFSNGFIQKSPEIFHNDAVFLCSGSGLYDSLVRLHPTGRWKI
jgi:hypothetical protein